MASSLVSYHSVLFITSPAGAVATYCDEHISLSVCLSRGYLRTSREIFTKFLVHVTYVRGSVLLRHVDDRPHRLSARRGRLECTAPAKCNLRLPCLTICDDTGLPVLSTPKFISDLDCYNSDLRVIYYTVSCILTIPHSRFTWGQTSNILHKGTDEELYLYTCTVRSLSTFFRFSRSTGLIIFAPIHSKMFWISVSNSLENSLPVTYSGQQRQRKLLDNYTKRIKQTTKCKK